MMLWVPGKPCPHFFCIFQLVLTQLQVNLNLVSRVHTRPEAALVWDNTQQWAVQG